MKSTHRVTPRPRVDSADPVKMSLDCLGRRRDGFGRTGSLMKSIDEGGKAVLMSLGLTLMAATSFPLVGFAEDELAAMANGQFKPDLVSSECFATSCKDATQSCVDDADCKKGLMCTARCLGDSACITGCFARFGNEVLNNLLQCSIEDYKCINIAIISPGAQPPEEVEMPPRPLSSSFSPESLDGEWYKVLGWNRQYDCFDCQKNTFSVNGNAAAMQVDFSMAAKRAGRPETVNSYSGKEEISFDPKSFVASSGVLEKSHRTAHTQGRMFGLTFWENWCVGAP